MNSACYSGLIFGFLGSLHCVGMCGPLVLALPIPSHQKSLGVSLYHSGRILCYAFLGMVLSFIGISLRYSGLHEAISVALGVVMLISVVFYFSRNLWWKPLLRNSWLLLQMKFYWQRFFQTKSLYFLFLIGFFNGLLPCGFVYVALSFSLLLVNALDIFCYMIFFGLGTIPALLGARVVGKIFSLQIRQKIQLIVPISFLLVAVLLIIRGLSLDIPYISPVLKATGATSCH